jgi:hypothetical protein
MPDNATIDKIKVIKNRLNELKKMYKKIEIHPCQNDAELRIKDDELTEIIEKIYALEKKRIG